MSLLPITSSRRCRSIALPGVVALAVVTLPGTEQGSALAGPPPTYGQSQQQEVATLEPAPLADHHRDWLERVVVYIIGQQEKAAFESLTSDQERDLFIEAFWRNRDPTPGTLRNEVKEEHERRLAHADRMLGRETPRAGWQTDRGRIYIQLGEPRDIMRYHDPKGFWPMELWFYDANPQATDLPPFFYVLFFRPEMIGDYVIYDPFVDGPGRLAKSITMQMAEPRAVVQQLLRGIGYEVAAASLSLIPGERADLTGGVAAPGSEQLFLQIGAAPLAGVDMGYVQDFLLHRGDVEAQVRFTAMPVDLMAMAFWDERGVPYLHYAVQVPPEKVILGEYERNYYMSMDVSVEVSDMRGEQIESDREDLQQDFDRRRAELLIRTPLAYYDRLELVPGVYDVNVEVRNKVSDEAALVNGRISVPAAPADDAVLGELLVAAATRPAEGDLLRPFQVNGNQFLPVTTGRMSSGETAHLFAQLVAGPDAAPGDVVEVSGTLTDAEGAEIEVVHAVAVPLEAAPRPTALSLSIPLSNARPGPHRLRLNALLPDGRSLTREREVELVAGPQEMYPTVLMSAETAAGGFREYQARGWQHLRKGELATAEAYFRAGLEQDPAAYSLRRALAQLLADRDQAAEAARIIAPLAQSAAATAGDLLVFSRALQSAGDPARAVSVARALLARWSPTAPAYNALADALVETGETTEAAAMYRASLALDPEQPAVEEKLARISGGSR